MLCIVSSSGYASNYVLVDMRAYLSTSVQRDATVAVAVAVAVVVAVVLLLLLLLLLLAVIQYPSCCCCFQRQPVTRSAVTAASLLIDCNQSQLADQPR